MHTQYIYNIYIHIQVNFLLTVLGAERDGQWPQETMVRGQASATQMRRERSHALTLLEAWNALPQPIASLEKSGACLEIMDYQIAESFIHRSQCQQHWKKQWKPKTVEAAKTASRCCAKGA